MNTVEKEAPKGILRPLRSQSQCTVLVLGVLLWGGCDRTQAPAIPQVVEFEEEPTLWLSDKTVPTHYELTWRIDPQKEAFSGHVVIGVQNRQARRQIWLHGKGLTIEHAYFARGQDVQTLIATQEAGSEFIAFQPEVSLQSDASIPVGEGELRIEFSGRLGSRSGLFRQVDRGGAESPSATHYVYSDFEATDARKAFPCFDEPRFKTPFTIEVVAPSEHRVFSNMPEIKVEAHGQNMLRHRFDQSPPLPTYLVAAAIGPFDLIEGRAGKTPLRIIAPRGDAEKGRYVLQNTGRWLAILEEYLGEAMPYPKLDLIAVPTFEGAMENPGLVTFSREILLLPNTPSDAQKRRAAGVTAHELAHMWFGNKITPARWEYLWLNEGFATWLSDKVLARWRPLSANEIVDIVETSPAMPYEYGVGGRVVEQSIRAPEDLQRSFDAITYRKGGAIFSMIESFVGDQAMQRAVQDYLQAGDWGSVDSADLVASFARVLKWKHFDKFVHGYRTQAGIPMVTIDVNCERRAPTLSFAQKRTLPFESQYLAKQRGLDTKTTWKIPLCLRFLDDQGWHKQCVLLDAAEKEVALDGEQCPTHVIGNVDGAGYYHTLTRPQSDTESFENPREKQHRVTSLVAAMRSGALPLAEGFSYLGEYTDEEYAIQWSLLQFVTDLGQRIGFGERRPNFEKALDSLYEKSNKIEASSELLQGIRVVLARFSHSTYASQVRRDLGSWLDPDTPHPKPSLAILAGWLQVEARAADQGRLQQIEEYGRESLRAPHSILVRDIALLSHSPELLASLLRDITRAPLSRISLVYLSTAMTDAARVPRIREALLRNRDAVLGEKSARETHFLGLADLFAAQCDEEGAAFVRDFARGEFESQWLEDRVLACVAFRKAFESDPIMQIDSAP